MHKVIKPNSAMTWIRQAVVGIILLNLLLVGLFLIPMSKQYLITNTPLGSIYWRYSKWRYQWKAPADVGDGKDALEVLLEGPMGLGEDSQGNVYISDRNGKFIWKIAPSHRAMIVAGTGLASDHQQLKTDIKALAASLDAPEGLFVDLNDEVIFASSAHNVILRFDRQGLIRRVAGTGQRGWSGDGGPATEATLAAPYDVRQDAKGNIFIADSLNHRVRKIDRQGVITTVAGSGVAGFSGDGGPAVVAQLKLPYAILLDSDDNLIIADSENHVLRKVGKDGIIMTIAGCGQRGFSGDGGPALAAKFDTPQGLAMDAQGRLYIDDEHNHAIRVLELDGTIRTLVGLRGPGFSGDGHLATEAQIADPENILVRRDGTILISARDNARIRSISLDGTIQTWAGRGPSAEHPYFKAPVPAFPHTRENGAITPEGSTKQ
jgi:hypothetical protein